MHFCGIRNDLEL